MENVFLLVMVRHMLNNRGFTLIETLFVMMILCILFTLTMSLRLPIKKEEVYIREISSFFYEAKLSAMLSKETVELSVGPDNITYKSLSQTKSYQLKNGCYFQPYKMTFNENGNVKTAKTLIYHHDHHEYRFVYQIGSGAFYVE